MEQEKYLYWHSATGQLRVVTRVDGGCILVWGGMCGCWYRPHLISCGVVVGCGRRCATGVLLSAGPHADAGSGGVAACYTRPLLPRGQAGGVTGGGIWLVSQWVTCVQRTDACMCVCFCCVRVVVYVLGSHTTGQAAQGYPRIRVAATNSGMYGHRSWMSEVVGTAQPMHCCSETHHIPSICMSVQLTDSLVCMARTGCACCDSADASAL